MERNRKPNDDQSGASVFTTLGTLVLTARPYESASRSTKAHTNTNPSERSAVNTNGASLKGEIFQIVNKDVSDVIVTYMYMYGLQTSLKFIITHLHVLPLFIYMYTPFLYVLTSQVRESSTNVEEHSINDTALYSHGL